MHENHETSSFEVAGNLALFRRWCFATYGGVACAFLALDADGSGSLSEEEFVDVIQNSSFKGHSTQIESNLFREP